MKTREQIETFKWVILHSIDEVKKDPHKFGVKEPKLFETVQRIKVAMLDWVLSDNEVLANGQEVDF